MKAINKIHSMKLLVVALVIGVASLSNIKAADNSELKKEYKEEALTLENWMSDLSNWKINEALTIEKEADIELESWMMDPSDKSWNVIQKVDKEEEMQVEDWMTNLKDWR